MTSIIIKILFVVGFGGLGFLYYIFIGCKSGYCAITSNPFISTGYGALVGAFIAFALFPAARKKPEKD